MFEFVDIDKYRNKSGIYAIHNKKTGLIYVGQTRQAFNKRFMHHRWKLRRNMHDNQWLQASYNKYGENVFEFLVLVETSNFDELNKLEIREIEKARLAGQCCNMLDGGGGRPGIPLSEKRKKELGELNRILNTGKKASEETKKKMSQARKGKKRKEATTEKILNTKHNRILSGQKIQQQKLTPEQVIEIKKLIMNGNEWIEIAQMYGVSRSNINAIRSNRSWQYVVVDGWENFCESHKYNVRARQSRSAN